jgi:hypothetical protein
MFIIFLIKHNIFTKNNINEENSIFDFLNHQNEENI